MRRGKREDQAGPCKQVGGGAVSPGFTHTPRTYEGNRIREPVLNDKDSEWEKQSLESCS